MDIRRKTASGIAFHHGTVANRTGMFAALHSHNHFELLYIVSGDIAHVVEGRQYLLKAGDLVLVQPSTYHYLQILSDAPYERYNILFDPLVHGIPAALQLPKELEVINLAGNSALSDLFFKMDLYAQASDADFEQLMQCLLKELSMNLLLFPQGTPKKETVLSPVLSQALDYINANLYTVQDVEEVAKALFISSSHLYRLFSTTLHQTPKRYILEKRLLAAQRLLHTGNKPYAVYRECGFREYTTFFRCYKEFFGVTPSEDFQKA